MHKLLDDRTCYNEQESVQIRLMKSLQQDITNRMTLMQFTLLFIQSLF